MVYKRCVDDLTWGDDVRHAQERFTEDRIFQSGSRLLPGCDGLIGLIPLTGVRACVKAEYSERFELSLGCHEKLHAPKTWPSHGHAGGIAHVKGGGL
jgi:hypothetical protein